MHNVPLKHTYMSWKCTTSLYYLLNVLKRKIGKLTTNTSIIFDLYFVWKKDVCSRAKPAKKGRFNNFSDLDSHHFRGLANQRNDTSVYVIDIVRICYSNNLFFNIVRMCVLLFIQNTILLFTDTEIKINW